MVGGVAAVRAEYALATKEADAAILFIKTAKARMVQGAKDWKKAKRRLHVALNTPELAEAVRLLPIAEERHLAAKVRRSSPPSFGCPGSDG